MSTKSRMRVIELETNIARPLTSLGTLEEIGWKIDENQGGKFFRNEYGLAHPMPFWVSQLIEAVRISERESIQRELQRVIGLK